MAEEAECGENDKGLNGGLHWLVWLYCHKRDKGRLKTWFLGFQTTFVLPEIGCLRNQVQIADAVIEAVGVVAFFVHLDTQAQVVGGNGLAQGFVVFDLIWMLLPIFNFNSASLSLIVMLYS